MAQLNLRCIGPSILLGAALLALSLLSQAPATAQDVSTQGGTAPTAPQSAQAAQDAEPAPEPSPAPTDPPATSSEQGESEADDPVPALAEPAPADPAPADPAPADPAPASPSQASPSQAGTGEADSPEPASSPAAAEPDSRLARCERFMDSYASAISLKNEELAEAAIRYANTQQLAEQLQQENEQLAKRVAELTEQLERAGLQGSTSPMNGGTVSLATLMHETGAYCSGSDLVIPTRQGEIQTDLGGDPLPVPEPGDPPVSQMAALPADHVYWNRDGKLQGFWAVKNEVLGVLALYRRGEIPDGLRPRLFGGLEDCKDVGRQLTMAKAPFVTSTFWIVNLDQVVVCDRRDGAWIVRRPRSQTEEHHIVVRSSP